MTRAFDLTVASTVAMPLQGMVSVVVLWALVLASVCCLSPAVYFDAPLVFAIAPPIFFVVAMSVGYRASLGVTRTQLLHVGRSLEQYGPFEYAAYQALPLMVPLLAWAASCALFATPTDARIAAALAIIVPGLSLLPAFLGFHFRRASAGIRKGEYAEATPKGDG